MESVEKQKQLFPSFHSPLEISQKARDSHIPTAWRRPGWKSGKPKSGFPLSHAGLATMTTVSLFSEQKTKKGDRPLRGLLIIFQDHLVLETESDFRIILRLENAHLWPPWQLGKCLETHAGPSEPRATAIGRPGSSEPAGRGYPILLA
jgi:hypothetical protein